MKQLIKVSEASKITVTTMLTKNTPQLPTRKEVYLLLEAHSRKLLLLQQCRLSSLSANLVAYQALPCLYEVMQKKNQQTFAPLFAWKNKLHLWLAIFPQTTTTITLDTKVKYSQSNISISTSMEKIHDYWYTLVKRLLKVLWMCTLWRMSIQGKSALYDIMESHCYKKLASKKHSQHEERRILCIGILQHKIPSFFETLVTKTIIYLDSTADKSENHTLFFFP